MTYFYLKNAKNNCYLMCMIVLIAIFFLYVYPALEKRFIHRREHFADLSKAFNPIDILNVDVFSHKCCTNDDKLWPVSINDDTDKSFNNYYKSTLQSANGCACLKKEQVDMIQKCN